MSCSTTHLQVNALADVCEFHKISGYYRHMSNSIPCDLSHNLLCPCNVRLVLRCVWVQLLALYKYRQQCMVRYSAKTWDCSVKHRQCTLLFRNPSLIKGTRSRSALVTRCVSCIKIAFATWAWTGTLMLERRGRDERGWGGCILFFADSCIDCALSNSLAYCDFALKCGTSSLPSYLILLTQEAACMFVNQT